MKKLKREFYSQDTIAVAKKLLGKTLVHDVGDCQIQSTILDVEAYTGVLDRACHSFGGRRTNRTEILWGEPGHAYIYMIYGMYYLLNVVSEPKEHPCGVLIRGVLGKEESLDRMSFNRYNKQYSELSKYQITNLSNGPGKVCKALELDMNHYGLDLLGNKLYILDEPEIDQAFIQSSKRINIDYAEEAKDFLYRFYLE